MDHFNSSNKISDIIEKLKNITKISFISTDTYLQVDSHKLFLDEGHQLILLEEFMNRNVNNSTSTIQQIHSIFSLPALKGIVGLPDMHQGYYFPVGSVIAVDLSSDDAWISPEGVGYDINCGVRCVLSSLDYGHFKNLELVNSVADKLNLTVPSGFNKIKKKDNSNEQVRENQIDINVINDILDNGLNASFFDYLDEKSKFRVESMGSLKGNHKLISQKAKGRGISFLGTIGSGNHYLEIQYVEEIFDDEIAKNYGLKKNQIVFFVHTGSRGLGHEVCSEFSLSNSKNNNDVKDNAQKSNKKDNVDAKDIVNNSIQHNNLQFNSDKGQQYYHAMNSASNYAFANRELISKMAIETLKEFFPDSQFQLLYDCAHNIAKIENINGEDVLVHRKGASRAAPSMPNESLLSSQPIPVGGSMATSSYILSSTGPENTFYSSCHGSGRIIQRSEANKHFTYDSISSEMASKSIVFRSQSQKGMVEEAGGCYKDIDLVADHSQKVGLTKKVAKMKPIIVIKG